MRPPLYALVGRQGLRVTGKIPGVWSVWMRRIRQRRRLKFWRHCISRGSRRCSTRGSCGYLPTLSGTAGCQYWFLHYRRLWSALPSRSKATRTSSRTAGRTPCPIRQADGCNRMCWNSAMRRRLRVFFPTREMRIRPSGMILRLKRSPQCTVQGVRRDVSRNSQALRCLRWSRAQMD